jgi:hypothetical protein
LIVHPDTPVTKFGDWMAARRSTVPPTTGFSGFSAMTPDFTGINASKVSGVTAVTGEKYDAGTSADDFLAADEPPEDIAAGEEDAPYGWRRDDDGNLVPRKKPGRPRKQATPEEMPPDAEPVSRAADRPPARTEARKHPKTSGDVPMPRGGVIAAGVNKLYRRGGKIIRAMDPDIGNAVIACTRKDEDDELTVGEAWEALAKTNPRIRAFILRAISGGAWGDLVMAHAPIGLALFMKPQVQRLLRLERLVESMAEPDEDTPEGEGGLPGGMTMEDFGQMRDMAAEQARRMAAKMGVPVSDEQLAEAVAHAGIPPGLRAQPRRRTRAARRG